MKNVTTRWTAVFHLFEWRRPVRTAATSRPSDWARPTEGASIEMKKRFAPRQKMTRLCVSKNVENAP